mgnify:CR=1 FL=1
MNSEEYAALAIIVIMPIISYMYGRVLSRNDCRFILASLASMLPVALIYINPLIAIASSPIILIVLYGNRCGEWLKAIGIIAGEIVMGVLYLEAIFGNLSKLLIIVPQIQLGFFYSNNIIANAVGVASESVNSLLFPLMYLISLIPLMRDGKWRNHFIFIFLILLFNAGTWVDLPTLPLITPTLPLIAALNTRSAGVIIGYLITYMREASVMINYLASTALAILISWKGARGEISKRDLLLLAMIVLSAAANLLYAIYLSMLFFFLFSTIMSIILLRGTLRDFFDGNVSMNTWLLPLIYAPSFLAFTMSFIEAGNPTQSMVITLTHALSSPIFSIPVIISMLPFLAGRSR